MNLPDGLDPALLTRIEQGLGEAVAAAEPAVGGYTNALRLLFRMVSGRRVFAKIAASPETRDWLLAERRIYDQVQGRFMPDVLAWIPDDERPALILEDLSGAHWPPPWQPGQVHAVVDCLAAVAATPPPEGLPRLEDNRDALNGWLTVAESPDPFLTLRLCSQAWLEAALPRFLDACDAAPLAGDDLVHLDLRSDNLCFKDGAPKIVDWNFAHRGNGAIDLAGWLPSLYAEGGPAPHEIVADSRGLSALLCGYWAARAGLPAIPHAPRVRQIQRAQVSIALPWVIRELGLPPLDGPVAGGG